MDQLNLYAISSSLDIYDAHKVIDIPVRCVSDIGVTMIIILVLYYEEYFVSRHNY